MKTNFQPTAIKKTRVPTLKVAPSELPILGLLSSDYFQAAV